MSEYTQFMVILRNLEKYRKAHREALSTLKEALRSEELRLRADVGYTGDMTTENLIDKADTDLTTQENHTDNAIRKAVMRAYDDELNAARDTLSPLYARFEELELVELDCLIPDEVSEPR
jgi:hypothetical protein